jgi:hypothetical protein
MFKHCMRWLLPFLVIALIALYLVLSPVLSTYAAAPQAPAQQQHHAATQKNAQPLRFWRP